MVEKKYNSGKSIDNKIGSIEKNDLTGIGPTFDDVIRYAKKKDGAIDLLKMQRLEGRYGYNGGKGCDVLKGPCSCGAWH